MVDQGSESPLNPSFVPVANPSAVFREEESDNWGVLVDMDSAAAMSLNPTGVRVWKLIDGKRTVTRIAEAFRNQFEEAPQSVLDDVLTFVEVLIKQGFVGYEVK